MKQEQEEIESKVCYVDADGKPRAMRGRVRIENEWVVVQRFDGTIFRFPVGRVAYVQDGGSE